MPEIVQGEQRAAGATPATTLGIDPLSGGLWCTLAASATFSGTVAQGSAAAATAGWYVRPGTGESWTVSGTVSCSNMIAAVETGLAKAAQLPASLDRKAATASLSTTLCTEDRATLAAVLAAVARGTPVSFTVSVNDVAGRLKATAFPIVDVSIEVDSGSAGAVSFGGSTVTSADLANAVGSREDGLKWADLHDVWAVCATGQTATLRVRAVVA